MSHNNNKFDNDPENIIADIIKILVKSTDTMSNKLPDDLLENLYARTNFRDATMDGDSLANLIFTVYSCYKTLKGVSDWNWDLSEEEFTGLVVSWHLLLAIERMRREKIVIIKPFKILDFDTMDDTKINMKVDETIWQSLLN